MTQKFLVVEKPFATISARDCLLLATVSVVLHASAWLWWSHPLSQVAPPIPPKVVEILLVPSPVPVIEPAPPVAAKPVITPSPKPPPLPKAKVEQKTRPKLTLKPRPQPIRPAPTPLPAPQPVVESPVLEAIEPAAPAPPPMATLVPASTKATSRGNPKPDYPGIARDRGWEGKVLLAVEVLANGRSGTMSIATSSGHPILDDAAMQAVRRWLFEPARRGDTPVVTTLNLSIVFKLED
jgi:periplasmic protein TonB